MRQQGIGGSIINISSSRDRGGMAGISAYAISKAAFTIFSRCIALELAPFGIRVNTIAPGFVDTDMHQKTKENPEEWGKRVNEIPLGRPGNPSDIAPLAVYLAADSESGYTTGSRYEIDGGRSLGQPPKS